MSLDLAIADLLQSRCAVDRQGESTCTGRGSSGSTRGDAGPDERGEAVVDDDRVRPVDTERRSYGTDAGPGPDRDGTYGRGARHINRGRRSEDIDRRGRLREGRAEQTSCDGQLGEHSENDRRVVKERSMSWDGKVNAC